MLIIIEKATESNKGHYPWWVKCPLCAKVFLISRKSKALYQQSCNECARKKRKHFNNLLGQRFTRLLVIKEAGLYKHHHVLWECYCNPEWDGCGKTSFVSGNMLVRGQVRSCGCLRREQSALPTGEAAFNHILRNYKSDAIRRNHPFQLSNSQFRHI